MSAIKVKSMSDREIVDELESDSLLNRVRKLISASAGEIEQAYAQRKRPSPVEVRRMELTAAERIIAVVRNEDQR